jgi:hypothetical protein
MVALINNITPVVHIIVSLTIPSPMSKFIVSGMRYDFPKPQYYLGFGKSASRNERNKYPIGDGIA